MAPRPYGSGNDTAFSFVRAGGQGFTAGASGAPFYFLGANYWAGMSLAASGPSGDRERLRSDLDALAAAGVTQLRVLGAAEGPDSEPWRIAPSLTPCPGVYNADVLRGFDFLIAEMGARRMRATVVLGDEWAWSGGHVQYVRWAQALAARNVSAGDFAANASACVPSGVDPATGAPLRPDITNATWRELGFQNVPYPGPGGRSWSDYQALAGDFYGIPLAQKLWRDHAAFMITHVNAFTGLAARDDPTIMAWQLANEPRAADPTSQPSANEFLNWLRDSAAFIKRLAPNQMVSSGMGACGVCKCREGALTCFRACISRGGHELLEPRAVAAAHEQWHRSRLHHRAPVGAKLGRLRARLRRRVDRKRDGAVRARLHRRLRGAGGGAAAAAGA